MPDGNAWRIDDHSGPWLLATHPLSSSTLRVRTWIEAGRASRARCEERLRLTNELPSRDEAQIIEQHPIDVPQGFNTQVVVGLAQVTNESLSGFVTAVGGRGHRCFAYLFATQAVGPGRERAVGERLATIVEQSLAATKLKNDLVPEIRREPLSSK